MCLLLTMTLLSSATKRPLAQWGRTLCTPDTKGLPSHARRFATPASANRPEGSIGDAFTSLSKYQTELPPRFGELKKQLVGQNGDAVLDSWMRLIRHLEEETIPSVNELSHLIIPEVEFSAIVENGGRPP